MERELTLIKSSTYSILLKGVISSIVFTAIVLDKTMLFYCIISALTLLYFAIYALREVSIEYEEYVISYELIDNRIVDMDMINLHTDYNGWLKLNKVWIYISEVIKEIFSR